MVRVDAGVDDRDDMRSRCEPVRRLKRRSTRRADSRSRSRPSAEVGTSVRSGRVSRMAAVDWFSRPPWVLLEALTS